MAPGKRALLSGAGFTGFLQQRQTQFDHLPLHRLVPRFPTGIPQRKVREQESRNTAVFDYVATGTQDHRADAALLQDSCDQTHGLVTYRSQRHQQSHVYIICLATAQDLGCIHLQRAALTVFRGYTVKPVGQMADSTLFSQILQVVNGEE